MQCEYCHKEFTHRSNLCRHKKTAKYCLELQKHLAVFPCPNCGATFTQISNLNRHYQQCSPQMNRKEIEDKVRQEIEMQSVHDKLTRLQETVQRLMDMNMNGKASSGAGPNFNMVVNNLQPVSEEAIQEQSRHLTLDFILDGASGFASFANNYALAKQLLCTDRARKRFRYKDEEGNMVDDAGGLKLAQKFFKAIAPKNTELINREYSELQKKVEAIANDGADGEDLQKILSKSVELQNMLKECNDAADGKHNELSKEFIAHLTKLI